MHGDPYTRELPHDDDWLNGEVVVYTGHDDPFAETASFNWGPDHMPLSDARDAAMQFIDGWILRRTMESMEKESLDNAR